MDLTPEAVAAMNAHRRRYEELRDAGTGGAPRALPGPTPRGSVPIAETDVVVRERVPGGWYTTLRLRRGEGIRLVNVEGSVSASLLAWSSDDPSERINHADTVKIQWTAALRKGRVIFSDMGRVLLSIVEDTSGAHDALMGGSTAASTLARYGEGNHRNTRDNFILAAAKLGLGRRDVPPCVTFFAPVVVGPEGRFLWNEAGRSAGDFVDLRAEMDLLVALSACPHPLDPRPAYAPGPLDVVRYRMPPPAADDLCRTATAEAVRGFENTDAHLAR